MKLIARGLMLVLTSLATHGGVHADGDTIAVESVFFVKVFSEQQFPLPSRYYLLSWNRPAGFVTFRSPNILLSQSAGLAESREFSFGTITIGDFDAELIASYRRSPIAVDSREFSCYGLTVYIQHIRSPVENHVQNIGVLIFDDSKIVHVADSDPSLWSSLLRTYALVNGIIEPCEEIDD